MSNKKEFICTVSCKKQMGEVLVATGRVCASQVVKEEGRGAWGGWGGGGRGFGWGGGGYTQQPTASGEYMQVKVCQF